MQCISPLSIKNSKVGRITVPCGKCNFCLSNKRKEWAFRIGQEAKSSDSGYFLTLTYDDQNLPISDCGFPTLCKTDVQLFLKRLRRFNEVNWEKTINDPELVRIHKVKTPSVRYFICGEYGRLKRPHYHAIIFNLRKETIKRIDQIWQKGFVHVGNVEPDSIDYSTKYMINRYEDYEDTVNPFSLMSKGIGKDYLKKNSRPHKATGRNYVVNTRGFEQKMPRYYSEKLFNRIEKDVINEKAKIKFTVAEAKKLKKLEKLHNDPIGYMEQQRIILYGRLRKQAGKSNKL